MTDRVCGADEFDVLLSSYCDCGLSGHELAQLNRLLRSSPVLRRRYLHYMGVHAAHGFLVALTAPTARMRESELQVSPPDGRDPTLLCMERTVPGRYFRSAGLAVSILLLIGVTCGSFIWWS